MTRWSEFAAREPELAESVSSLLYFVGVGLGFLATVRRDGGPRLHPVCPLLDGVGLYGFIVASPKRGDLLRDRRYALHSFPMPDNEDAAYITGVARPVADSARRALLADQFAVERSALAVPPPDDSQQLFEFLIDMAMVTRTAGHADPVPQHRTWRAQSS